MKYKTVESVCEAIVQGDVTRTSAMVMKRRHYSKMNDSYGLLLENGIRMYDMRGRVGVWCSFYNKTVDSLDLLDLVTLEKNKPEMFTYDHAKRYSIIMFGASGNIEQYEGQVITPSEIRNIQ